MLANRLSKQINRVSKIIKKRIEDYNKNSYTGQSDGSTSLPDKIEFDTLSNPDEDIWATIEGLDADVDGEVLYIFQTEEARNRFGLHDKALRWRSCAAPSGHGALLSALRWSTCYLDCWASNLFRCRWVIQLFSIGIKLAKLQNVLSRQITINVNEFILLKNWRKYSGHKHSIAQMINRHTILSYFTSPIALNQNIIGLMVSC